MKQILLFILTASLTITVFSQRDNHEKIKAFKTAFITEKLDLSSKEAEQFWPIYNVYSKKERQYKIRDLKSIRKRIKQAGGIDTFSNIEANNILQEIVTIENNLHKAKQNLIVDLKPVISTKKILKLYSAEKEFNRKLLKRIQEKRKGRRP